MSVRRRVAVVSSCAPPLAGLPVTGGGIRTAQLIATLEAGGHRVVTLIEAEALPEQARSASLRPFARGALAAALAEVRPSAIVVEQWALLEELAASELSVGVAVDLHGSLLLENVFRRGAIDLELDATTKLRALRRADLLLVPAVAQLHHFASWATLAGFDPREPPLALLPLAPVRVDPARGDPSPPLAMVYGGARWPWIDSASALATAAQVVAAHPGARLEVATHDPPRQGLGGVDEVGTWAEADRALHGVERVIHHRDLAHADWLDLLSRSTVALDLWEPNAERLLACTTRTVEFLAAGLPVVTTQGAAWENDLLRAGAGWTVPAGDPAALHALLAALVAEPARIAAASAAATALAASRADLERSGRALLAFVARPHRPPRAPRSVVEAVVATRAAQIEERLTSLGRAHAAEHEALVASHRSEIAALSEGHRAALAVRDAAAAEERRRLRTETDARVRALEADTAGRLGAQSATHAEESARQQERAALATALVQEALDTERRRAEAEGARAARRAEEREEGHRRQLDELARAHQEHMGVLADRLREAVEARDTLQGRWNVDRAHDKEARARLEVTLRAEASAREAGLLARIEELTPPPPPPRGLLRFAPGRVVPAARLARLWVEHALDRDGGGA